MKIKRIRGMRDVPTIQGLRHRSLPSTREQTVAEQARLEHEKARLKREMSIWIGNQKKTEERLRQVEERLALLQQILNPTVADDAAKRARVRRSPAEKTGGNEEDEAQSWREIPLEY
jgi:septal ring factor EnvC (AmiA/AmiB activator)